MGTHFLGTPEQKRALDAYIKLLRATDSVKSRVGEHQTTSEIGETQFGTLEMLYHLGPLNQKQIGEKLLISKSNVVAVIDRLEKQKLVRRERCEEDRRHVFVHLTEAGEALVDKILPIHVSVITEEMSYLTNVELVELGRLCRKLGLQVDDSDET